LPQDSVNAVELKGSFSWGFYA